MQPPSPTISPLNVVPSDVWTHLSRGVGYWLVTVIAVLTGAYYDDRLVDLPPLTAFCLLLLPFYIVHAAVYDLDPQDEFYSDSADIKPARAFVQRYLRGTVNNTWVIAAAGTHVFFLLLLFITPPWAHSSQITLLQVYSSFTPSQGGYFLLLWFIHAYYAAWILRKREDPGLRRVRYETFLPVLIVAFSFFFGATYRSTSPYIYLWPATVFAVMAGLHFYDKRHPITPKWYFRLAFLFILLSPTLPLSLGRLDLVARPTAAYWAASLLTAFSLSLYLSVFELWKRTGISPTRDQSFDSRRRHFDVTLVAHAAAITALPLMFAFGRFGPIFLSLILAHATGAFLLWYVTKGPTAWQGMKWPMLKLAFGFSVFGIVCADLYLAPRQQVPADIFPRDIAGISASLLTAVFLAVLATPFLQYLTDQGRNRNFRELLSDFVHLPTRTAVFRLAAVFSGIILVADVVLYEFAYAFRWANRDRLALAFWIFLLMALGLSIIAFFGSSATPRGENVEREMR